MWYWLAVIILSVELVLKCYTQTIQLNANEPERKTHCTEEICQIICLPAQCGNERIKTKKSVVTKDWVDKQQIEVICRNKYSCGGRIVIDGQNTLAGGKYEVLSGTIRCDENPKESCYGGHYVFHEMVIGVMSGDTRESDILFRKVDLGAIQVKKGPNEPEEQFFMNKVWTDDVMKAFIRADADWSIIGSYFDLTGLAGPYDKLTTEILCLGTGSCAGSIFVLRKCGGTTKIICGPRACKYMTLIVLDNVNSKATKSCTPSDNPTRASPAITITTQKDPTNSKRTQRGPVIFVVCPKRYHRFCATQDKATSTGPDVAFDLHETSQKWMKAAAEVLASLNSKLQKLKETPEILAEIDKKPNDWIREPSNREYFAGVMFEAALGTVTVGAAGGFAAAGIVAAIAGTAFAAGVGAVAWPLLIPGVIIVGAIGYRSYVKRKRKKRYAMPSDMQAFASHQEIYDNMYDDMLDREAQNQYVMGEIEYIMHNPTDKYNFKYDLLTGEIWNQNENKESVNYVRHNDYGNGNNVYYGSHENMVLGVMISLILVACCGLVLLFSFIGG
eukprot:129662_1